MRRWLWITTSIALVGCATPYREKGLFGGYEDFPLERSPDVHFVSFEGNVATEDFAVYRNWRRRVDEVCGSKEWQILTTAKRERIVPIRRPRFVGYVHCGPPAPSKLDVPPAK